MANLNRIPPSWMQQWWLWFTVVFGLTLAIFWPTFLSGIADYKVPVIIHGISAIAWMLLTIVQALLIKNRQRKPHRTIGYIAPILATIVVISGLQMERQMVQTQGLDAIGEALLSIKFFYNDVTGLALFCLFLALAILAARRRDIALHLRLIACTAIIPIMPALIRFFESITPQIAPDFTTALLASQIALISLVATLVLLEWRYSRLRWPFAYLLGYYIFMLMTTEFFASHQWLKNIVLGFSGSL
ncbi:hypothetical protein [Paraglaciecola sp.]|uniref:hypothetical protein n=1 Tax=Paraglaciecola sp. TaxID=1920173 RepID=UPI003EF76294